MRNYLLAVLILAGAAWGQESHSIRIEVEKSNPQDAVTYEGFAWDSESCRVTRVRVFYYADGGSGERLKATVIRRWTWKPVKVGDVLEADEDIVLRVTAPVWMTNPWKVKATATIYCGRGEGGVSR